MLHLLIAAALSTASPKPLFVPPKRMKRIAEDHWARRNIGGSRGAKFVAEYRGTVAFRPNWATTTYEVPERIAIVTHPTTINAQEWGVQTITRVTSVHVPPQIAEACARRPHCSISVPLVKKIIAEPIALCNGQRGWENAFTRGGDAYVQVFARAGDRVYVAVLQYQLVPGDVLHAAKALSTLCPAGVGEVTAATTPVPLSVPKGWTRGVGDLDKGNDSSYKVLAYWLYLPRNSTFAHYLTLGYASDVSEYVTPEQDALDQIDATKAAEKDLRVQTSHAVKLCGGGADGWFSRFTATDAHGDHYTAETMYAYGNNTSYLLRYVRAATEPEDSQAHKALFSLCPPQSPTQ